MVIGFGKIEFDLACRFGELTQNETRVLVYLYVCRNEETGVCNPRRRTISDDAKIDKGNLSKAIKGLEEKGWILEHSDGHFQLFSAGDIKPKVVELTTEVVKSPTKVVEVTTESCRSNNSHIKDLNRERTEKEQRINTLSETDEVAIKPSPVKSTPKPKPKPEDSPEIVAFRKQLAELQDQHQPIRSKGKAINNAKAVKDLFKVSSGDATVCLSIHLLMQSEEWRTAPVFWTTVLNNFEAYRAKILEIKGANQNGSVQTHNSNGYRETDQQRRAREAAERNATFRQLDAVLAERDRVLQSESGANRQ